MILDVCVYFFLNETTKHVSWDGDAMHEFTQTLLIECNVINRQIAFRSITYCLSQIGICKVFHSMP